MASGLVAHRKSLAYTGRDLSKQVVANLVGSPDLILEKIDGLKKIGVDHACALMIPADSMAEFEDQVECFAKTVRSADLEPFAANVGGLAQAVGRALKDDLTMAHHVDAP